MGDTAVLGYFTLMDVINDYTSLDGQAQYIYAAKVLSKAKPFIRDMPMVASNQIMSNIGSRESYLPTPGTRRFNEGVALSAGHTTPFNDPISMVEDYSEVDYALWRIQNDPNTWRDQKNAMKVEAMGQKMEDLVIYGSIATDPGAFNGFATRTGALSVHPNGNSAWPHNVVDGGGSGGDTTSVFIVQWGPGKVYGIYPKNLPGGLQIEDLGKVTINSGSEASPKYYEGLRTHFSWYLGIVVEDERCLLRYANIETSGNSNIFDEDKLITCLNNLPDRGAAPGTVIYAPRSICNQLDIAAKDKNNVNYTPDNVWGGMITNFRGIPVRLAEGIDETETQIV
ncbi:MAG: hypothetical protein PHD04_00875 [Candidatus Pacebacteria bacterium]|nr:hypothetical protein [Candidatus Paceibacterota bacterium]